MFKIIVYFIDKLFILSIGGTAKICKDFGLSLFLMAQKIHPRKFCLPRLRPKTFLVNASMRPTAAVFLSNKQFNNQSGFQENKKSKQYNFNYFYLID